jgi:hypothetical protein
VVISGSITGRLRPSLQKQVGVARISPHQGDPRVVQRATTASTGEKALQSGEAEAAKFT